MRYRTRFFNKKAEDFFFYPQVSKVHEIFDENGDIKNLDFNFRGNEQIDRVDNWCSLAFEPKLVSGDNAGKVFYLADQLVVEGDEERKPYMQDPDSYGIAVTANVINLIENRASISFIRPLEPLLADDILLEENQYYMAFINYGIFPSAETDREYGLVKGQKGNTDSNEPYPILIMAALSSKHLATCLALFSSALLI
jgi:hypothetical protein